MFFKQKIFVASFITLDIIAIFHYIGLKYELYWKYGWYDIPMHILGGIWAALFFLSAYAFFCRNVSIINYRKKIFLMVFLVLFFVTVGWEVFELWGGITFMSDKEYWFDATKDIFDGYVGGMIACLFYLRNKKTTADLMSGRD